MVHDEAVGGGYCAVLVAGEEIECSINGVVAEEDVGSVLISQSKAFVKAGSSLDTEGGCYCEIVNLPARTYFTLLPCWLQLLAEFVEKSCKTKDSDGSRRLLCCNL